MSAAYNSVFGVESKDAHEKHTHTDQAKFGVSKEDVKKGAFNRPPTQFHDRITADGSSGYVAEPGRYHLYYAPACPWAHRTLVVRALKGLEDVISVTRMGHLLEWDNGPYRGWPFTKEDPDPLHPEYTYLHDVYLSTDPNYPNRSISVPVLFDKKTKRIVNNESAEIIDMLNSEFNKFAKNPDLDLNPKDTHEAQTKVNELVYPNINDGVYRCGFAGSQEAYDKAVTSLFDALDKVEDILSKSRYLTGDKLTLSDIRLFTTLLRFDNVYHTHFKCNIKTIREYPNLWGFTRDVYQLPGVAGTVEMEAIKKHYFESHLKINPTGIVARGPELNFMEPHGRDVQFR